MEKVIKLKMENDKTLKIYINGEEKHSIPRDNRTISADKIYEIIGFTLGEHYTVDYENEGEVDEQVMNFFVDLFEDIIEKVNKLSIIDPTSIDNSDEKDTNSDDRNVPIVT